eukprot:4337030-Heterocapsa_arctica.AAC.1
MGEIILELEEGTNSNTEYYILRSCRSMVCYQAYSYSGGGLLHTHHNSQKDNLNCKNHNALGKLTGRRKTLGPGKMSPDQPHLLATPVIAPQ